MEEEEAAPVEPARTSPVAAERPSILNNMIKASKQEDKVPMTCPFPINALTFHGSRKPSELKLSIRLPSGLLRLSHPPALLRSQHRTTSRKSRVRV